MEVRRILLIDDEPDVRDVVTYCLSRPGYVVHAPAVEHPGVSDAACQSALFGSYHILLLDLQLPTIDPFDLLDRMISTASPTEPIAFAAFLPDEIRSALRAHGCNRFIEKPFTFSELLSEIDACTPVLA